MKLSVTFQEATRDADSLLRYYDALLTKNQRAARSDWITRFRRARLNNWVQSDGIWRSYNDAILMIGKTSQGLSHSSFSSESLAVLLRSALVMSLAAVDKVLHEAISRHFVSLIKSESLDKLVRIEISKSYAIAMDTRRRTGKGGRTRLRPGPRFKAESIDRMYRESYLSIQRLQEVCAALGKDKIFDRYGKSLAPQRKSTELQKEWSSVYARRNHIAHECDIVRKRSTRRVHFHRSRPLELREQIAFVKAFGTYLSTELE